MWLVTTEKVKLLSSAFYIGPEWSYRWTAARLWILLYIYVK